MRECVTLGVDACMGVLACGVCTTYVRVRYGDIKQNLCGRMKVLTHPECIGLDLTLLSLWFTFVDDTQMHAQFLNWH